VEAILNDGELIQALHAAPLWKYLFWRQKSAAGQSVLGSSR